MNELEHVNDLIAAVATLKAVPQQGVHHHVGVIVTPAFATQILKIHNIHNRKLGTRSLVPLYSTEIIEGRWQYTADAIRFSSEGVLLDGQNRLAACVQTGKSIVCDIVTGLPPSAQKVIDIGKPRTVGDLTTLAGVEQQAGLTSTASYIRAYRSLAPGAPFTMSVWRTSRTSKNAQVELIQNEPLIIEAAKQGNALYKVRPHLLSTGPFGLLWYLFHQLDPSLAEEFLTQLTTGEGVGDSGPVFLLRRRYLRNLEIPGIQRFLPANCACAFLAWNAYRFGDAIEKLRWQEGMQFPSIETKPAPTAYAAD